VGLCPGWGSARGGALPPVGLCPQWGSARGGALPGVGTQTAAEAFLTLVSPPSSHVFKPGSPVRQTVNLNLCFVPFFLNGLTRYKC